MRLSENHGRRANIICHKKILKPTRGKILVFALISILILFLPLYPTQVEKFTYYRETDEPPFELVNYSTKGTHESILIVIDNDYNWVFQESPAFTRNTIVYQYTAYSDLTYTLYIPLFIVAFILGCIIGEAYDWSRKGKDEYEPDVHLWKPWKDS